MIDHDARSVFMENGMSYQSPSTNQVAEAYELLKQYGMPRWVVENALKRAAACDPYPWKAR